MILRCSCAAIVLAATLGWRGASTHSPSEGAAQAGSGIAQCPDAIENPLPLPSSVPPDAFHDQLLAFLKQTDYVKLGWCVDKGVRDTGPYVYQEYLGTHPAVRGYYSPAIMKWLLNGRIDAVPDGAMIVKEMYFPGPAARYADGQGTLKSWTVMIKDAKASRDGWFWGGLFVDDSPMPAPRDRYT